MIKLAPSILSADFARLGEAIACIEESGAQYVHIDIMDGHFVPNITIGHNVVAALRPLTNIVFDVHLMVEEPRRHIESFARAGADIITIHAEACPHLHSDIGMIKQLGKKAGVAINPATPIEMLDWVLGDIDMVLIMSVNPGFGGQKFIKASIDKIKKLKNTIDYKGYMLDIGVDGGIDDTTAKDVIKAGASVIISGSAFFNAEFKKEYAKNIMGLI